MACNCGKTYNVNFGCCEPVLGPVENYYTKYQIDKMLEGIIESGCCITEEEVDDKIESAKTEIESEIPSLDGYATEQWVLDKHYISGVDLSDYALKSEIPTVPTSNTAFTNDAGYLTEHQSLSGYVTDSDLSAYTYDKATIDEKITSGGSGMTSGEVQTMIDASISGKQDTLSAGTNISINSNVISATDTKYTAGDNISISNQNVISTVTKFMCLTEIEWEQISGNTDSNTIYLIH